MDEVRGRSDELWAAVRDLRQAVYDVLTSRRLHRAIFNTFLFASFATFVYYLSIPAYAVFYHFHLPDQIVSVPLHLQYGYSANPFAIADLVKTNIKNTQAYDVDISLTLPHSPDNLGHGNFMVGLLLLDDVDKQRSVVKQAEPAYRGDISSFIVPPVDIASYMTNKKVLHSVTRATRVPYRSGLVSKVASLLRLPYYAVWPGTETNIITVRMAERLTFGRGTPVPSSLIVEVQAGQNLQVYEASVVLTAQLRGLRYFMYRYRVTAFILFTGMFWVTAMLSFSVVFALPQQLFSGAKGDDLEDESEDEGGRKRLPAIKKEQGDMSDTERTFPSSSKQPPLKFEPKIKQEEEAESDMILPLNPGAEADDEDDDWRARDSGIGTSYSDSRSLEGARKRNPSRGELKESRLYV